MTAELRHRVALGRRGVEQPRSVQVDFESLLVSPVPHSRHLRQRPDATASQIGRILHTDQTRHAIVLIVRSNLSFQVFNIQ